MLGMRKKQHAFFWLSSLGKGTPAWVMNERTLGSLPSALALGHSFPPHEGGRGLWPGAGYGRSWIPWSHPFVQSHPHFQCPGIFQHLLGRGLHMLTLTEGAGKRKKSRTEAGAAAGQHDWPKTICTTKAPFGIKLVVSILCLYFQSH